MFNCQMCNASTLAHQPVNRLITETRRKTYEYISRKRDRQSQGFEIIKELMVCPECYTANTGSKPKMINEVFLNKKPVNKPKFKDNQNYNRKSFNSNRKNTPIVEKVEKFKRK